MNGPSEMGVDKPDEDTSSQFATNRAVSRRELLKGVAGGSALLAAVRPIETLAQTTGVTIIGGGPLQGKRCSISGMQSLGASIKPGGVTCGGYSPGYYQTASRWGLFDNTTPASPPSTTNRYYVFVGGVKYYTNTPCTTLFSLPTGSSTRGLLGTFNLIDILGAGPGPNNTDESHWLAALLNAQNSALLNLNYPYTTSEVIGFYHLSGTPYTNAMNFFRAMEFI